MSQRAFRVYPMHSLQACTSMLHTPLTCIPCLALHHVRNPRYDCTPRHLSPYVHPMHHSFVTDLHCLSLFCGMKSMPPWLIHFPPYPFRNPLNYLFSITLSQDWVFLIHLWTFSSGYRMDPSKLYKWPAIQISAPSWRNSTPTWSLMRLRGLF